MSGLQSLPYPVFVVTIESNLTRARETVARLERHSLEPRIWTGVDGRRRFAYEPDELIDRRRFYAKYRREIHPTEIGCYLSHYRLLKHIQAEGHERAVVLEDDVLPLPALLPVLERLADLDPEVEYINLLPIKLFTVASRNRSRMVRATLHRHHVLSSLLQGHGTVGYMVTASGIAKVLPLLMPIHDPIDNALDPTFHLTDDRLPPDTPHDRLLGAFTLWPPLLQHPYDRNVVQGPDGRSAKLSLGRVAAGIKRDYRFRFINYYGRTRQAHRARWRQIRDAEEARHDAAG